jgi:hypothetical protein
MFRNWNAELVCSSWNIYEQQKSFGTKNLYKQKNIFSFFDLIYLLLLLLLLEFVQISGDNKGYASYLFEKMMNPPGTLPGNGSFVAAFAQTYAYFQRC